MPVSAGGHSAPMRGSVDANAYMVHEITINCRSIGPFCVVVKVTSTGYEPHEILWVRYPALTKNFNVFFVGSPHVVVQARGRPSSRDTEEATQRHLTGLNPLWGGF